MTTRPKFFSGFDEMRTKQLPESLFPTLIKKIYPLQFQNMVKLETHLLHVKMIQEEELKSDLYRIQKQNIPDEASPVIANAIRCFDKKFKLLHEKMLCFVFERLQNQVIFVCENTSQLENPFEDIHNDYESLRKYLYEKVSKAMIEDDNSVFCRDFSTELKDVIRNRVLKIFEQALDIDAHCDHDKDAKKTTNKSFTKAQEYQKKEKNDHSSDIIEDEGIEKLVHDLKEARAKEVHLFKKKWDEEKTKMNFHKYDAAKNRDLTEIDRKLTMKEYKIVQDYFLKGNKGIVNQSDVNYIIVGAFVMFRSAIIVHLYY